MSHFHFNTVNFTLSPPLCYSLEATKKEKIGFLLFQHIMLYQSSVENRIFRHNHVFKRMYVSTTHIDKVAISFCKYYMVISDTLIGSWMDFLCCLL